MTVDDFAAFLAARYDEAEALVKAALWETDDLGTTWTASPSYNGQWWCVDDGYDEGVATVKSSAADNEGLARYIADLDPTHRLADIALKRAILADVTRICEVSNDLGAYRLAVRTMRQLGTEFAGHPGYRSEWRPE